MLITGAAIKNTCVFGKKVHAVALRLHKNQFSFVFFLSPKDGCQQDWVYAKRRQRLTLLMHLISPVKANPPGQGCCEQGWPHCWYRVTGLTWISEVHYTVCQSIISRHPFHGYSCRIQTWNHSIQVRINWGGGIYVPGVMGPVSRYSIVTGTADLVALYLPHISKHWCVSKSHFFCHCSPPHFATHVLTPAGTALWGEGWPG